MAQRLATQHGGELNPLDTAGLCLLSLDGGGVRGLSTLYILKGLMDRLNHARKLNDLTPLKPCDLFDLVGGTSTGGLIAIMLGRLEMDVDDCITAYSKLMESVFEKESSLFPVSLRGRVKARFDSEKLKSAIEEVIYGAKASTTELFNDGKAQGCRTFVCSVAKETAGITRLRSYTLPDERDIPATICQAALATSAATGFFDAVSIGARRFVDGAFGANNPVDEVEGEAANIWSSGKGDLKPLVKCFVSIGTGNPGKKAIEDNMLKFLSGTLVDMVTEKENTERKFIARWAQHYDEKRYFRFNVDQGLQDVGLAEYKEQGRIDAATDEYLRHEAQKFQVRDCVGNLQKKQSETGIDFTNIMNEYRIRNIQLSLASSKACWYVPFERNTNFVGRSSQLNRLESAVFAKDQPHKIAVTGLGGIGKTQIALELAFRTREKYQDCSVFWIPAISAESLQQAFADVGRQVGVLGREEKQAEAKKLVQRHLSQDNAGPWLLIVDNIDDMGMWNDELKDFLPKSPQGFVVCTSRSRKVAVKIAAASIIEVSDMDLKTAMQLFSNLLADQELLAYQHDAQKLLEQLTFLPLAIVQAAAYINGNRVTLSEYMSLLKEQEHDVVELLSEEFEDDWRYRDGKNPVVTTWLVSFDHVRQLDPLAAEYLSFMACLVSKDIPQSLLPPGLSRKKEIDAVGTLDAYSFVSKRAGNSLGVHRLVHLSTRNWLRLQGQWDFWANKALARLVEVIPYGDHDKKEVWTAYLPHAVHVLGLATLQEAVGRMSLLDRVGRCERMLGHYEAAEWAYQKLLGQKKRLFGPRHPSTLRSMNELGLALSDQGKYAKAEAMHREELGLSKKVRGKEHPETLTSMNNLAEALSEQGQHMEAEKMHRETLALKEEVLGKKHSSTLASMNNLALALSVQGKYAEAEKINRETLALKEEVLGKTHPETLASMNNLAGALGGQRKYAEAETMHREELTLSETVLGKKHPNTLMSMNNLAEALSDQGKCVEAEKIHRETLALKGEVLGEKHPDTLNSVFCLAYALHQQQKYDDALLLYYRAYAGYQETLGLDHLATQQCLNYYHSLQQLCGLESSDGNASIASSAQADLTLCTTQ